MDDILVVCTANVARSPLLAALLQREADRRLGPGQVTVGSAGTRAYLGDPAAEGSLIVAPEHGVSLEHHRSRPVHRDTLASAELVVTMTRYQRRTLARNDERSRPRIFTLRELLDATHRCEQDILRSSSGHAPPHLQQVALNCHLHRPPSLLRRRLDVPDPHDGSLDVYRALATEFATACSWLGPLLFGGSSGDDVS